MNGATSPAQNSLTVACKALWSSVNSKSITVSNQPRFNVVYGKILEVASNQKFSKCTAGCQPAAQVGFTERSYRPVVSCRLFRRANSLSYVMIPISKAVGIVQGEVQQLG